jgi:hypothetical protein
VSAYKVLKRKKEKKSGRAAACGAKHFDTKNKLITYEIHRPFG